MYPIPHTVFHGLPSAFVRAFPDRVQSCIAKRTEAEELTDERQWVPGNSHRIFPPAEIPVLREIWDGRVVVGVVEGGHQGVGEGVQSERTKGQYQGRRRSVV